jgi:hypothetical protein
MGAGKTKYNYCRKYKRTHSSVNGFIHELLGTLKDKQEFNNGL